MRLTIDSSDRLTDVLAAVGALFRVQLAVSEEAAVSGAVSPAAASTSTGGTRVRRGRPPGRGARESRRTRPAESAASTRGGTTAQIRAWAREQGHAVSDRGRIPASLVRAYEEANS